MLTQQKNHYNEHASQNLVCQWPAKWTQKWPNGNPLSGHNAVGGDLLPAQKQEVSPIIVRVEIWGPKLKRHLKIHPIWTIHNPQVTFFRNHRRLTYQLCKFPFRQINEKKNMETEITIGPKGVPALLYLIFWHIGSFAPTETLLLGLMALQNFLGTVISLFIWKTIRWLYVHIIYSFDTLESLFIYFSSGYLQVSWSMPREIWCNPPTRMPSFGNVFAML